MNVGTNQLQAKSKIRVATLSKRTISPASFYSPEWATKVNLGTCLGYHFFICICIFFIFFFLFHCIFFTGFCPNTDWFLATVDFVHRFDSTQEHLPMLRPNWYPPNWTKAVLWLLPEVCHALTCGFIYPWVSADMGISWTQPLWLPRHNYSKFS